MDIYKQVEMVYAKKAIYFSQFEKTLCKETGVHENIVRDYVKRILVESVVPDSKRSSILYGNNISIIKFIAVLLISLVNLAYVVKRKEISSKFVFDIWNKSRMMVFYKGIIKLTSSAPLLFIHNVDSECVSRYPKFRKIIKNSKVFFGHDISSKVFFSQLKLFIKVVLLSKKSKIDFSYLSASFFYHLLLYGYHSKKLSCKYFISACDTNFNALRYWVYKQNGVEYIVLIQNGHRSGRYNNSREGMYTYADYYFGYGKEQIDVQAGMICKNKMPVGSLRLYNELPNIRNTLNNYFDVVYIEGYAEASDLFYDNASDLLAIKNLCDFATLYPEYRICYCTRRASRKQAKSGDHLSTFYSDLAVKLKSANIETSECFDNSYEAIFYSKVVVYYVSTMGMEALAFNKRVLCCNYNHNKSLLSYADEIGVLIETSYQQFEQKLLNLIRNESPEIDLYFQKKKEEYMAMNFKSNPNLTILEILGETPDQKLLNFY